MARRQNPKIERTLKRTSSLKLVKQTFLIVCEGEYSNQAFEYWFLLHFNLYQGSIHRSRYAEMLTHLLGFKYGKAKGDSVKVFNVIYPRTRMAIDNAKNVLKVYDGSNPAKDESSTTVHQLVERLLLFTEN